MKGDLCSSYRSPHLLREDGEDPWPYYLVVRGGTEVSVSFTKWGGIEGNEKGKVIGQSRRGIDRLMG